MPLLSVLVLTTSRWRGKAEVKKRRRWRWRRRRRRKCLNIKNHKEELSQLVLKICLVPLLLIGFNKAQLELGSTLLCLVDQIPAGHICHSHAGKYLHERKLPTPSTLLVVKLHAIAWVWDDCIPWIQSFSMGLWHRQSVGVTSKVCSLLICRVQGLVNGIFHEAQGGSAESWRSCTSFHPSLFRRQTAGISTTLIDAK